MRTVRVVVVALLLALAGCGAAPPAGRGTETATVTPAPVPAAPDDPDARLAPGLAPGGVVDPSALLAAHRERLTGHSFRTTRLTTLTDGDGTVRSRVRTVARFDGEGRYLVERRIDGATTERLGTATRIEQYADREGGYRRRVLGDGDPVYSRVGRTRSAGPAPTALLADPLAGRDLVLAFGTLNTSVVARERGERGVRYVVVGGAVRSRATLRSLVGRSDVSGVRNVSLSATVTEAGLVESFEIRYAVVEEGTTRWVLRRGEFSAVGATTVARPGWYATAANRTG